jgi:Antibiotic biosynthesis monooxygenase
MVTMFVKHTVQNYGTWKGVYEGLAPLRKEMGVTAASVHRDAKDPNTLIVTHQFSDLNAANAFANSENLKSAMGKGGVTGHPEFWFAEDIEHTAH